MQKRNKESIVSKISKSPNDGQEKLYLQSSEKLLRYDQSKYPVNEGNSTVFREILRIIPNEANIKIVTGYAGLTTIIDLCIRAKEAKEITKGSSSSNSKKAKK